MAIELMNKGIAPRDNRGRYLKLKERTPDGSNLVVIPLDSLGEIADLLARLKTWSDAN